MPGLEAAFRPCGPTAHFADPETLLSIEFANKVHMLALQFLFLRDASQETRAFGYWLTSVSCTRLLP